MLSCQRAVADYGTRLWSQSLRILSTQYKPNSMPELRSPKATIDRRHITAYEGTSFFTDQAYFCSEHEEGWEGHHILELKER
jgi:hypothetical protein